MSAVSIDQWDLLHLLLSVEDKLRSDQDQGDLDGVLLRTIAALDGVRPAPIAVPFEVSAPLVVEAHPLWIMQTNAWLLASPTTRQCVVVDVPPNPATLADRIAALDVRLEGIFITHAHLDHAGGTNELLERMGYPVPVYVHARDRDLLLDPRDGGAYTTVVPGVRPPPADAVVTLSEDFTLTVGPARVTAVGTPGHTPGSVCAHVGGTRRELLLTGDAVFAGGSGRCDLLVGSRADADASRYELLSQFDDDVVVLPGHGGITTVGAERVTNVGPKLTS